jgi:hypothetical protein
MKNSESSVDSKQLSEQRVYIHTFVLKRKKKHLVILCCTRFRGNTCKLSKIYDLYAGQYFGDALSNSAVVFTS